MVTTLLMGHPPAVDLRIVGIRKVSPFNRHISRTPNRLAKIVETMDNVRMSGTLFVVRLMRTQLPPIVGTDHALIQEDEVRTIHKSFQRCSI